MFRFKSAKSYSTSSNELTIVRGKDADVCDLQMIVADSYLIVTRSTLPPCMSPVERSLSSHMPETGPILSLAAAVHTHSVSCLQTIDTAHRLQASREHSNPTC